MQFMDSVKTGNLELQSRLRRHSASLLWHFLELTYMAKKVFVGLNGSVSLSLGGIFVPGEVAHNNLDMLQDKILEKFVDNIKHLFQIR